MNKRARCASEQPGTSVEVVKDEMESTLKRARRIVEFEKEINSKYARALHFEATRKAASVLPHKEGQIFYKTMTGKTRTLQIKSTYTVEYVKYMIEKQTGIETDKQRLIFAGKQLEDGRTLAEYRIEHECTIHLIMRIRGC